MTVKFDEAKYLQPVLKVPTIGLKTGELDRMRQHGYDFHDFEKREGGGMTLTMISDFPFFTEDRLRREVDFLKAYAPYLVKINIVAKRLIAEV